MPRWWVLSVLLAGSAGAAAAAKMPPKPAAHRPALILSQEKPEQPPKLAATDVAQAAVKVGRLRGGGVPWRPRPPDKDRVGTAVTIRVPANWPAMLLFMAVLNVYYFLCLWLLVNLAFPLFGFRYGFRAFVGLLGTQFDPSDKLGCFWAALIVLSLLAESCYHSYFLMLDFDARELDGDWRWRLETGAGLQERKVVLYRY